MTDARANHHAHARVNLDQFVVQLHLGSLTIGPLLALQKVIGLCQSAVVVETGVGGNLGDVDRAGKVGHVGKRSPRGATGTGNARDLGEINQFVAARGGRRIRHRGEPRGEEPNKAAVDIQNGAAGGSLQFNRTIGQGPVARSKCVRVRRTGNDYQRDRVDEAG